MSSVKNLNVLSFHEILRKIDHEVRNSVSQGISHMREPDLVRLDSYVNEIEAYHAHVLSQDPVDWPHAANLDLTLTPIPDPPETESTSIQEILVFIRIVDTELCKSQSKDLPAGLVSYDSGRLTSNLAYLRSLIGFIRTATPTDRPESAASEG